MRTLCSRRLVNSDALDAQIRQFGRSERYQGAQRTGGAIAHFHRTFFEPIHGALGR